MFGVVVEAEHHDIWEVKILQSGNMTSPSELVLQDHGFDAGNLSLLQDFAVGDEVTLVDVKDGVQATLVEALEEGEADVAA